MMKDQHDEYSRYLTAGALLLTIPAFYLALAGEAAGRLAGYAMYGLAALALGAILAWRGMARQPNASFDQFIFLITLASAVPVSAFWGSVELAIRLCYCAVVCLRLFQLLSPWLLMRRLALLLVATIAMTLIAGAGFYWLEPQVTNFADGIWLAFITGATVGYGDLVPSTPAARILAGFTVLLGYALFSVVTARIAALLVGEDERRQWKDLHTDLRKLRSEIVDLRAELKRRPTA